MGTAQPDVGAVHLLRRPRPEQRGGEVRKKNVAPPLPPIQAVSVYLTDSKRPAWAVGVFTALFDPSATPEPGYRWGAVARWSVESSLNSSGRPPKHLFDIATKLSKTLRLPLVEGIEFDGKQGLSPIELLSGMGDEDGS